MDADELHPLLYTKIFSLVMGQLYGFIYLLILNASVVIASLWQCMIKLWLPCPY